MEAGNFWSNLIQNAGIIGSLLLAVYTITKDGRGRKISNSIAITEQYQRIWQEANELPELSRVQAKFVDLAKHPVSHEEEVFVTKLVLHLSTVYRAMKYGELIPYEGLQRDVREFFHLPIPRAVWRKLGPFQDDDFRKYIESALK